ncbi:hypothetical protein MKK88_12185 [Methylobacterium sp. E-005]|uniref:hypothetical protein n=1 Tax=Methylobacterium sp. E-005 TaxID=2836549 RepID=UPI001FB9D2B8|nr:hypothetical protein [Methylobacterium sp. E-005]MCJ2086744.1 hypothetical protein [Methylobacterium sp. E-005]
MHETEAFPSIGAVSSKSKPASRAVRQPESWEAAAADSEISLRATHMRILVGCEMTYEFLQPTPIIATLNVHASRFSDLERPDYLITTPAVPVQGYRDSFGNWCSRMVAPAGRFTLRTDTIVRDPGGGDPAASDAGETAIETLPSDTVLFLLGSRYCETDRLSSMWIGGEAGPPTIVKAACCYQ